MYGPGRNSFRGLLGIGMLAVAAGIIFGRLHLDFLSGMGIGVAIPTLIGGLLFARRG